MCVVLWGNLLICSWWHYYGDDDDDDNDIDDAYSSWRMNKT